MTAETDRVTLKPYILWVDYGAQEGWQPMEFESCQDLLDAIQMGDTNGNRFTVTRRLQLAVQEVE